MRLFLSSLDGGTHHESLEVLQLTNLLGQGVESVAEEVEGLGVGVGLDFLHKAVGVSVHDADFQVISKSIIKHFFVRHSAVFIPGMPNADRLSFFKELFGFHHAIRIPTLIGSVQMTIFIAVG